MKKIFKATILIVFVLSAACCLIITALKNQYKESFVDLEEKNKDLIIETEYPSYPIEPKEITLILTNISGVYKDYACLPIPIYIDYYKDGKWYNIPERKKPGVQLASDVVWSVLTSEPFTLPLSLQDYSYIPIPGLYRVSVKLEEVDPESNINNFSYTSCVFLLD